MDAIIKADLYRYVPEQYSLLSLLKGFRSQGFLYMFLKRKLEKQRKWSVKWVILKIVLRHFTYKYGFQIGGRIGGGFYISHFGIIVISTDAVIGKNCNIAHGVTIGVTRRGKRAGAPIIGNNVWIGANSIIVGKITISDNVLVAPGSYINFDVPENSIVIGNPGSIKYAIGATDGYINNPALI